jgi:hypothetical protein
MLKAVVDELARRFATANANAGRQRLREKTDDLVLDLLAALKTASLGEIADTTHALERRRKGRTSVRPASNGSGGARKSEVATARDASDTGDDLARATRDPFDITVPNDLLEPTSAATAAARESARTSKQVSDMPSLAVAPSGRERQPSSPPSVALRAGEELLRTGGSGAIIRRIRGS